MTILLTILIMSVFCVGVYCLMQEGMILNFLRQGSIETINELKKSLDMLIESENKAFTSYKESLFEMHKAGEISLEGVNKAVSIRATHKQDNIETHKFQYELIVSKFNWLKPITLCLWCFASFWGTIAFVIVQTSTPLKLGYDFYQIVPVWLLCIVCTVPINGLFDYLFRTKLNLFDAE